MGRPSGYTPEIAARICERLSEGEPLAVICRDDGMPAVQTVSDWRERHEDFSVAIARAREAGFDAIALEALEIADDAGDDFELVEGQPRLRSEHVQRSKLRVDTRLKLLSKWDPKRYGDKVALTGGDDSDAPIKVQAIRRVIVDPQPDNRDPESLRQASPAGEV